MKLTYFGSILLLGAAVSASNAGVYELSHQKHFANVVSRKDSILYLADKFGIGDYYSVGDGSAVEFIEAVHETDSAKPNLVVVVKGVDDPSEFFESQNVSTSFEVALDKKGKNTHGLVHTVFHKFPKQIASAENASSVKLTREIKLVAPGHSTLKLHFVYFEEQLLATWNRFTGKTAHDGNVVELQNSGLKLVNDKFFINELSQLIHLKDGSVQADDFVFAHLHSLLSVGRKIGYDSKTYKLSKRVMGDALISLQETFDVTILAVGTDSHMASDHAKRSAELDNVFAASKRGAAVGSCFADEEACQVSTSNCNSHGACTKVKSKCWQCVCKASFDKKKSKTTNWTGADCSKRDISAQAHLLLWTSVGLLATLVGGIKLLASVGSESLPGVLEAATASKKAT